MADIKDTIINGSTLIPIGGVMAIIATLIGTIFYAGRISEKISSHDLRLSAVEAKVELFVTKEEIKNLTSVVNSLNNAIRSQNKLYVEEVK